LTSDTSSLPEVLDWEPATFSPEDPDGLAEIVLRSLTDADFRSGLLAAAAGAAARHTWDAVVERTVEAYARLDPAPASQRKSPARKAVPLRIALVGPFPPARSGVSRYNHDLALRLEERCRLDVFHDRGDPPRGEPRAAVLRRDRARRSRVLPAFSFGQYVDPNGYDAVIYTIGNSPWHHETFRLALRYPGIVWFHDVDLVTLYLTYAQRLVRYGMYDAAHKLVSDAIERYGGRAPITEVSWEDNRWAGAELYGRSGVRFSSELAMSGRHNIVGTDLARTMLELDAGPLAALPPTHVVPLAPFGAGIASLAGAGSSSANGPAAAGDGPLIVALGIQDLSKHPSMLIDAVVALGRSRPVRLAFVGEIGSPLREQLDARVRALGAEATVSFTGFVDDATYRDWIARATIAVQLRSESKGESSGAVYDAFLGGLPVITGVAACEELPTGTVRMLEPTDATFLAGAIADLLDDPAERARMSDAGRRLAGSWSLDDVAEQLLEIAREDVLVGSTP
jgi:glycosyltransferase involved in cell wall biosynthesis